jgi:MFS family permease
MTAVEALRGQPTQVPRVLVAGAIGNVLEWYDFAAYGYFASAFGRNFFPSTDHLVSLISAFGVFAVAFMMRPIGSIIFGHIGDRYGRKRALMISVTAMALSTFAIGLLPTYAHVGALAPLLLILLRMIQGVSTTSSSRVSGRSFVITPSNHFAQPLVWIGHDQRTVPVFLRYRPVFHRTTRPAGK